MREFLLIHGGSHGAWCWERCIEELTRLGHTASAIDLPGHGSDSTPRETVTIASYISAVSKRLDHYDKPVTIVGHSLAGILLPNILTAAPKKIEEAVFLAAIILNPGEAAIDFIPEDRRSSYFERANASLEKSFLAEYEVARAVFFNDLPEEEARRYYACLTPQPLSVYLENAIISPVAFEAPTRYIVCSEDRALGYKLCLEFANKLEGPILEINAGHDVMLSQPRALAELLVGTQG